MSNRFLQKENRNELYKYTVSIAKVEKIKMCHSCYTIIYIKGYSMHMLLYTGDPRKTGLNCAGPLVLGFLSLKIYYSTTSSAVG